MQFGFERPATRAPVGRQRVVKERAGPARIAGPGFRLGQRDAPEVKEGQNVLFAHLLDGAAHVLEAAPRAAALPHPALEKDGGRGMERELVLAREAGELGGVRFGARRVATHQFEQGRLQSSERERAGM